MVRQNCVLLHTDDAGYIWASFDATIPATTALKADDFVRSAMISPGTSFKVIATKNNVALLLKLYGLKLQTKIHMLKVCSPTLCNLSKPIESILLDAAKWSGLAGSLGGWHEFNEDDYISYYLANALISNNSFASIVPTARLHPVWYALKFIPTIDDESCIKLVSHILDPRWFVDLKNPDRNSRLEASLGLYPKAQASVSSSVSEKVKPNRISRYTMCALVMSCWKTNVFNDTDSFLTRLHRSEKQAYKADLKTSKKFVSYLCKNWLHELYRNAHRSLFVSKHFFNDRKDVMSYDRYINNGNEHAKYCNEI